ncbi:MAG: hypothetical protein P8Y44_07725 [Acidobacteriota bacterium]
MGKRLALLVTGASGMALPRHVVAAMAASSEVERIHLVVSRGAVQVLRHELESETSGPEGLLNSAGLNERERAKIEIHRDNELDAPISSGSYTLDGAAIIPCIAGTTEPWLPVPPVPWCIESGPSP